METIIKFFSNDRETSEAKVISKTLGRVALVSRLYRDKHKKNSSVPMPGDQEFWRVRIVTEMRKGSTKGGSFIVEPIARVMHDDLLHLLPGMYTASVHRGRMVVTPNPEYRDRACILPLDHKHLFATRTESHCVIVDVTPVRIPEEKETNTKDKPKQRSTNPYK